MKKLALFLIVPLLFGVALMGCEPIDESELPEEGQELEQEQEM
ncbi:MAG: hypothetical protein ACQETQ_06310 [Spirochaetota bacterium]